MGSNIKAMGLFDRILGRNKGLNPNVRVESNLRYLNTGALKEYESGDYVT